MSVSSSKFIFDSGSVSKTSSCSLGVVTGVCHFVMVICNKKVPKQISLVPKQIGVVSQTDRCSSQTGRSSSKKDIGVVPKQIGLVPFQVNQIIILLNLQVKIRMQ